MLKKPLTAIVWIAVLILGGCNNAATGDNQQRTQSYDADGYLGLTNTNPNLQSSPSYHTYETDADMIHNAAISVQGVEDTRIRFGTGIAYVTLQLSPNIDRDQVQRIKQEAFQAITYNMPRYTVQVTTNME